MSDKQYFVDEALAKGLAQRFIKEFYEDNLASLNKRFFSSKRKLNSRTDYENFISEHKKHFENRYINYLIIGSKRNPNIAFNLLKPIENRYFKGWLESCLGSLVYVENVQNYFQSSLPRLNKAQYFAIGEHALSRVYQRSKLYTGPENFRKYEILPEFNFIALWASLWFLILRTILNPIPLDRKLTISLYIPSPNGLFICNPSTKVNSTKDYNQIVFIDVRTYIHKDALTDQQAQIRTVLLDISKNLINSPLAFWSAELPGISNDMFNIFYSIAIKRILKNIDLISESFFEKSIINKISDDFDIYDTKKYFNDFKVNYELDNMEDIDTLDLELSNIDIRDFLIKHHESLSLEKLNFLKLVGV